MVISTFFATFTINFLRLDKIINYIFKEAAPIPHILGGDRVSIMLNLYSDFGIFFFFLVFSFMCFFYAGSSTPKEAYAQRIAVTYLLGIAMLSCAISRGLNVLAYWHNYYFLNGIVKVIGTLASFAAIVYVPFLLKAIRNARDLDNIKASMKETSKKIDELKELNREVLKKGNYND